MMSQFGRLGQPGYQFERCGFVDRTGTIVEVANRSFHPGEHYKLFADDIRKALRGTGNSLLAVWHTHPPPSSSLPSAFDLETLPDVLEGIIVHIESGGLCLYRKNELLGKLEK